MICGDMVREWRGTGKEKLELIKPDIQLCKFSSDDKNPCSFGCHKECLEAVDIIQQTSMTDIGFICNDIKVQMRPQIIAAIKSTSIDTIEEKRAKLAKTHRIKPSSDRRKRRYENSSSICALCHEEVPLMQSHHLLQHCSGLLSTPVTLDHHKDLRAFSKRCLEIADKRLGQQAGLACTPERGAMRDPPLVFGDKDGESLSEVAPRRKKRRQNLEK